jgi:hypothetical protein
MMLRTARNSIKNDVLLLGRGVHSASKILLCAIF